MYMYVNSKQGKVYDCVGKQSAIFQGKSCLECENKISYIARLASATTCKHKKH